MTAHPEILDLPVLPLRDVVVFPHMVIPLFVGRDKSIRALDLAMESDKRILLVAQKSAETDDPAAADLHEIGTLAQVLQLLKLPDGTIKVLVEGTARTRVDNVREHDGALSGHGVIVESVLLDTMYELPSLENVSKVVVDESVIEHKSEPYLIYQTPPAPAKVASGE